MIQRIHIIGASGSGTTTLAKSVADGLDMRRKATHEKWISELTTPFIRIEGIQSIEEKTGIIKQRILLHQPGGME